MSIPPIEGGSYNVKGAYESAKNQLNSIHESIKNIKAKTDLEKRNPTREKTEDVSERLKYLYTVNETISNDIRQIEEYYESGLLGQVTGLWNKARGDPLKQAKEDLKAVDDAIKFLNKNSSTANRNFDRAVSINVDSPDRNDFKLLIPENATKEHYESATEKLTLLGKSLFPETIGLSRSSESNKNFVNALFDPQVPIEEMEKKVNKRGYIIREY